MSKINLDNYELYLLDFNEGVLSESDKSEMDLFLQQHPQILEQLLEFINAPVLSEFEIQLPSSIKSSLKKDEFTISKNELNILLIKELEADLTEKELNILTKQLNTSEFLKEKKITEATKLFPDLSLIFPNKESLKKRNKIISLFYYTSVAASLLIAFGSYYLFNAKQNEVEKLINKKQLVHEEIKTSKAKNILNKNKIIPQKVIGFKKNTTVTKNKNAVSEPRRIVLQTIAIKPLQQIAITKSGDELTLFSSHENNSEIISFPNEIETTNDTGYLTISEFINKKIKQTANKNQKNSSLYLQNPKVDSYDIASLAVSAIATVSGMKIELEKTYSNKGELKEVALVGENFEFSRKK